MSSRIVTRALFAVLATALAACQGPGSDDAGTDPTAVPTTATSAGTPGVEGTGAEPPAPDGGGEPAIETVGLPVGGAGVPPGERGQCAFLNWNPNVSFPAGVQITVTEANLDRGATSGGCNGIPPCVGYTFVSNQGGCSVKLTVEPGDAKLSIRGTVACSLSPAECQAFRDSLAKSPIGTPVTGPTPTPTSSPSPTWTSSPTETSPPTETDGPEPSEPGPDEPPPPTE